MNQLKILFLMSVYTPTVLAPKWKTREEEIIGEEDVILKIEVIGIIEEVIEEINKVREVVVEDLMIKMIMIIREKHAKLLKKMTMIHLKSRKSVKKKSNSTKMMLLKKINSLRDANSPEKISHQEKINKINSNRETPIQII